MLRVLVVGVFIPSRVVLGKGTRLHSCTEISSSDIILLFGL